jgi:hypothetical protein
MLPLSWTFHPRIYFVAFDCTSLTVLVPCSEVYESILDWKSFSIRIAEKDIEKTPEILKVRYFCRFEQVWMVVWISETIIVEKDNTGNGWHKNMCPILPILT